MPISPIPPSMFRQPLQLSAIILAILLVCPVFVSGQDSTNSKEDRVQIDFFESKIRPVLVEHCYECHSAKSKEASGQLLVDSQPAMRKGGERGDTLLGDTLEAKLLWKALSYQDQELQMPPSGKLPQETLDAFRVWIEHGAVDPRKEATTKPGDSRVGTMEARTASHWAYKGPTIQPIPEAKGKVWGKDPIDRYLFANMESIGLSPSPMADRRTLIKRLAFDLTGLPASMKEIADFESNRDSQAIEKLVDNLVESPHFGERFARYWMDVSRYADTKGYVFQEDREYPHAHRFRSWLIRSFNEDLPYNEFVRLQLAADRLDPENKSGHLDAMGMLTLGRRFLNNKNDIADDRIDVVTRGLMAMTVGCARCHDHKFDPVKMSDYYSLHGVFVNSDEPGGDPSPMRLVDRKEQQDSYIFLRGQQGKRGDKIERLFVQFLAKEKALPLKDGSGRIDLANAIVSPDNPLTARVYVNRIWGWLMGTPLVDSTSDFGLRCEPPLQQAVLDRLAIEFMENGWSTKRLVKRIVLSSVYQQSSSSRDDGMAKDPENRYWWRANRRRMELETYLDAMLVASEKLDRSIGGPSVKIHEPPYSNRRTVYAHIDRQNLPGIFRSFDFASPDAHSPKRSITTVPQQGLFALNSGFVLMLSNELASKATASNENPIQFLFKRILAREPSVQEISRASDFLKNSGGSEVAKVPQVDWRYGYGRWDFESKKVETFLDLPSFANKRWSGGTAMPDPKLGWVSLDETGGHPGDSPDMAAIRRWIAPQSGTINIDGNLHHPQDAGDGIRAAVVRNRTEVLGEWSCKNKKEKTSCRSIQVNAGDTIDFVVDSNASIDSDTFKWTVQISLRNEGTYVTKSKEHFSGNDLQREFGGLAQLAQALLATNEFCFVD